MTRTEDIVARTGGDEFAIVLPETDAMAVAEVCKRIRKKARQVNKEGDLPAVLRISLGSATRTKNSQDIFEIQHRADKKMYRDKERNKNQEARRK